MKFSSSIILAFYSAVVVSSSPLEITGNNGRRLDAPGSCFGSNDFSFYFKGDCNFDSLVERMRIEIEKNDQCINGAKEEILLLLGITDPTQTGLAHEKVRDMCKTAADNFAQDPKSTLDFTQIAGKGKIFDKNYYDGGSFWNQEYQTEYDKIVPGEPANVLKRDADRVDDVYETIARTSQIKWPDLPNFESCSMRAAMCCWVTDRQANDNNGNCKTPYDERCTDADPGDNTDLCAVDFSRSGTDSVHIDDGFSLYEGKALDRDDSKEGPVHCHGFAWGLDELEPDARYKANNLFYVSMSDHMHDRGYVRNVPGAPMCGCVEQMPLVSRSDCTEIDAKEFWKFEWNSGTSTFTTLLERAEIEYNACRGAHGRNNDLFMFYKRLLSEGRTTQTDYDKLGSTIVGNDNCHIAVGGLLASKGYERLPPPTGWEHGFCVKNDGRDQNSGVVKLDGDDYGPDHESINKCLSKCKESANTGCEVIYGQGNRGCYRHTQEVARGNAVENHLCYAQSA